MKLERYEFESGDKLFTYEFLSEGRKGKIQKLIQFSLINEQSAFYTLAFGDKNPETGKINDMIITDNGDSEKVLATVVAALYAFCNQVAQAWVYATGSTDARTRLYRMGINKYFDIVQEIFGLTQSGWERFVKGKSYQAFTVQRKNLTFEL